MAMPVMSPSGEWIVKSSYLSDCMVHKAGGLTDQFNIMFGLTLYH